jgi:ABC-type spermidine/putrescine transport system permease subunit I
MSVDLGHTSATPKRAHVDRRIGMLMGFIAATLAVVSFVHLAGYTPRGTKPPFDASHAGIAEAIIGVVLASGATAVARGSDRARMAAIVTTGFAILGFLVGLNMTARGGDLADVIYHVVTLPVLIVALIRLLRTPKEPFAAERGSGSSEDAPPSGTSPQFSGTHGLAARQ